MSSGLITETRSFDIGTSQLGPGARQFFELGPVNVDVYIDQLHRLQVTVDGDQEVDEIDESDNIWFTEYVLTFVPGRDKCGPAPLEWKFKRCDFEFEERYAGDDVDLLDAISDLERSYRFPIKRGFTKDTATAVFEKYIVGAVSEENWELLEGWFFRTRWAIARVIASSMKKRIRRH